MASTKLACIAKCAVCAGKGSGWLEMIEKTQTHPTPALPCASIRCADCLLDPLQGGSGEELPNRNTHFALVLFYPELLQNAHTEQGLAEVRGNRRRRILDQEWPERALRDDRSTRTGRAICRLHQDLVSAIYLR